LSLRDNHHQIATDFLIQIVALFSPRLSRYTVASHRINYAGALIEFRRHVVEEGMGAFAGSLSPEASNVIPFSRPQQYL
jgi:hypothetical protein